MERWMDENWERANALATATEQYWEIEWERMRSLSWHRAWECPLSMIPEKTGIASLPSRDLRQVGLFGDFAMRLVP